MSPNSSTPFHTDVDEKDKIFIGKGAPFTLTTLGSLPRSKPVPYGPPELEVKVGSPTTPTRHRVLVLLTVCTSTDSSESQDRNL